MHQVRAWLLISCGVLSGACGGPVVAGSGKIATESRPVADFSTVSLGGSGHVIIEQTGTESLTITTDDNLLPYIEAEVRGTTLQLGVKQPFTSLRPTRDIVFKLTVKQLEGLEISGSGQAEAKGLDTERLGIEISGAGTVAAQGTAHSLGLNISGSGSYDGEQLKSTSAAAAISGSGSAVLAVNDTLTADVSGSGSIEYVGNPHVTQNVSGSGSVDRR